MTPFKDIIHSTDELRTFFGEPSELVKAKEMRVLDHHCRAFIQLASFVLIGTVGADGIADVSPRGDQPGFVRVIDDNIIAIPDRPGNRRVDTLRNIVETNAVGLLFMIPGVEETLRVNGRAWVVRDAELLETMSAFGKVPQVAIGIEIAECFLQCAKALKRAQLWRADQQIDRSALPSLAQMIFDQAKLSDTSVEALDEMIVESYTSRLY